MRRSVQSRARRAGGCAAAPEKPPLAALQALFMRRSERDLERPRMTRMIQGKLQQAESSKTVAQSVIKHLSERLAREFETTKATEEVAPHADTQDTGSLFIGAIEGLVMQSLLCGDIEHMRALPPEVLEILLRSVEQPPRV